MTAPPRRVPRTGRGARTRDELLAAAEQVFWDKGYVDTRVADIVERAGVSHGSFYTWFDSKETVLWALASELHEILYRTGAVRAEVGGDEVRAIELATRRYLEAYLTNRRKARLVEEVATYNDEMREARLATRQSFVRRARRSIERLQAEGRADAGLDAACAAEALVGMVSSFAYHHVSSRTDVDLDVAVATLTTLWARGIGLAPGASPDQPPDRQVSSASPTTSEGSWPVNSPRNDAAR